MKKFTAILLVLVLCFAAFAACSADEEGQSGTSSAVSGDAASAAGSEASEAESVVQMRIGGLTGPTSMGLVKLMEDAEAAEGTPKYSFTVEATADMITPLLVKGDLDMAAVPANLAAVLCANTKGKVQVLAINTLGVLYIVEKNAGVSSLADLKGKTVYATGKGSTPEYNLRYLLTQAGIDPDKDLTIEWKSEPNEVVALLKTGDSGVAMLPQPFVTVAETQVEGLNTVINLNDEWNKLDNGSMMVTGVLFARTEFVDSNKAAVDAFLEEYKASVEYINANAKEASPLVEKRIGVKAAVAEKAVPKCNLTFISGAEMKTALSGYLSVLFEQNAASVGGEMPADNFYYGA